MFKKIKDSIASIIYHFILVIVKCIPSKKGNNHLLIIKTDEIGDYILFRNYFENIQSSNRYKDYKITLIGNPAWKSLVEKYDNLYFDSIIWIDKKRFKKDLIYRFNINYQIRKLRISELINCVYSRSLLMDDGFAFVSKGYKAAMSCDDVTNRPSFMQYFDRFIYDTIIHAGDKKVFDNTRNRNFVSQLIKDPNILPKLNLEVGDINSPYSNYYVLFLGAGNPERKWPIENFISTANYINDISQLNPVLCGGPNDTEDANIFLNKYSHTVHNMVGKTTLPQFAEILSKATFIVSVDTGAVHLAAAVKCPVIGLFSGKFYKRFAPYPAEIFNQFYPIYPDFVDELINKNDEILYDVKKMRNDTIKIIEPNKINSTLDIILSIKSIFPN